jgi:hypothetical protein
MTKPLADGPWLFAVAQENHLSLAVAFLQTQNVKGR